MAIEAPDILEIEQVCDFAETRLSQLEGDSISPDEDPATEWERNCLTKTRAWLKSLKGADQMDRIKLAIKTLRDEGVLFWTDDDHGLELDAILHVSTSHIHEDTAGRLTATVKNAEGAIPGLAVFEKSNYGWFVYTHSDEPNPHIPDELDTILQWCSQNGVMWLCLDADAGAHPEFSTFDW